MKLQKFKTPNKMELNTSDPAAEPSARLTDAPVQRNKNNRSDRSDLNIYLQTKNVLKTKLKEKKTLI